MKADVVLFGTGSLARAIAYNVATTTAATPLRVLIVGRSRDDVEEVASVARGRTGAAALSHAFDTTVAHWADASIAGDILHAYRPTVAVVAASEQSPWDLANEANAWARLVTSAGFGVTLPFNASLASQVFLAASATQPRPFFINACYPDAVNALLAALGPSDRLVGVGNAAIIDSLYRGTEGNDKPVRVVAHHRHLGELSAGDQRDPPLVYADRERAPLATMAHALRAIRGKELNWVTGAAASRLILALVGNRPFAGSVPGPRGEIGGYPVTLEDGAIAIDLPPGLPMADARDLNGRAALREGVVVRDQAVHFSATARDVLQEHGYSFADGFTASRLAEALDELRDLRARLTQAMPSRG